MFDVYWLDLTNNVEDKVGCDLPTYEEAYQSIQDWWKQNGFEPMLIRGMGSIEANGEVTIDYGPHDRFYKIRKTD